MKLLLLSLLLASPAAAEEPFADAAPAPRSAPPPGAIAPCVAQSDVEGISRLDRVDWRTCLDHCTRFLEAASPRAQVRDCVFASDYVVLRGRGEVVSAESLRGLLLERRASFERWQELLAQILKARAAYEQARDEETRRERRRTLRELLHRRNANLAERGAQNVAIGELRLAAARTPEERRRAELLIAQGRQQKALSEARDLQLSARNLDERAAALHRVAMVEREIAAIREERRQMIASGYEAANDRDESRAARLEREGRHSEARQLRQRVELRERLIENMELRTGFDHAIAHYDEQIASRMSQPGAANDQLLAFYREERAAATEAREQAGRRHESMAESLERLERPQRTASGR